ncbi:MAG: hypothetical protein ACYDHF_06960 [Candidatus Cryosericum sp.]
MDQTSLFVFPRNCDFGRLATLGDVRAAASDPANVQRLMEATPDDVARELDFVARRIVADAAFAVRYESLVMALIDGSCCKIWTLLHPAVDPTEREHLRLRYLRNVFELYVRLQDLVCPDGANLVDAPSEETHP